MPTEFISVLSLLVVAVISTWCFKRVNLPPILAYLFAGIIVGPSALSLFDHPEQMHVLAEIGIVFLLFTLGLEFSLPKLQAMRHLVFGLGMSQMLLTTLSTAGIAYLFGFSLSGSMVIGGIIGLSSTAIVIKQTAEMGTLNTPRSQLAVSILLFQDLAVVPFLIFIPLINSPSDSSFSMLMLFAFLKGMAVITTLLLIGKWVLPKVFREIANTRTDELFVLTTITVVLMASGLTYAMGLSLALGAFIAGMMLGESQYKYQLESDIRPFQDILMGLFFVTVGMRLDLLIVWNYASIIVGGLVAMLILKIVIVRFSALIFNTNHNDAWAAAFKVCQMGEFSFILASLAVTHNVLDSQTASILVSIGILSMMCTPYLVANSVRFANFFAPDSTASLINNAQILEQERTGHVIILGYGRVGQSTARMLDMENINYIAVDIDPIRVQESQTADEPVIYGDVSDKAILRSVNIDKAVSVIVTFDHIPKATQCIDCIRGFNRDIPIIVRTRKDYAMDTLYNSGATQVVPELQEGVLMLVSQVYHYSGVPMAKILKRIRNERKGHYDHLHGFYPGETTEVSYESADKLRFMHAININRSAWAVGKTVGQCDLLKYGVHIKKIKRANNVILEPTMQEILLDDDILVISGKPGRVERAERFILDGH
ncbi:monovalent cation:proton antiporter family protein [Glaciecola sp. HTCC2999]|uniref:monovalent cation:proton antiporter family protein n=1 Tax=Glaciecola sp. HTCC2999 TaxID=455436 RepID=UPI0000E0E5FA|nr:monovalent cation:proton antiporter family protein [Glaciecola sp. HTCC2999]